MKHSMFFLVLCIGSAYAMDENNSLSGHMERLQISDTPTTSPIVRKKVRKKKTIPLGVVEESIIKNIDVKVSSIRKSAQAIEIIAPSLSPEQYKELKRRVRNTLIRSFESKFEYALENYFAGKIVLDDTCLEYRTKYPRYIEQLPDCPILHRCPHCKKSMVCKGMGHECLAEEEKKHIPCSSLQIPRNFSFNNEFYRANKHFRINIHRLHQNFLLLNSFAGLDIETIKQKNVPYFESHPKDLKVEQFDRVAQHLEKKCLEREDFLENLALLTELKQLLALVKKMPKEEMHASSSTGGLLSR